MLKVITVSVVSARPGRGASTAATRIATITPIRIVHLPFQSAAHITRFVNRVATDLLRMSDRWRRRRPPAVAIRPFLVGSFLYRKGTPMEPRRLERRLAAILAADM